MKRTGFTLIELLVVISIIALLLAILMPSLGVVKKKAQGVVCLANLDSMSKAWYLYSAENRDKLVGGSTPGSLNAKWGQDGSPADPWVLMPQTESGNTLNGGSEVEEKIIGIKKGLLWPYLENHKVYHCNADKRSTKAPAASGYSGKGGYRSYSLPSGANAFPHCGDWGVVPYTKLTQIRKPSSVFIFLEEVDGRGYNMGAWCVPPTGDH